MIKQWAKAGWAAAWSGRGWSAGAMLALCASAPCQAQAANEIVVGQSRAADGCGGFRGHPLVGGHSLAAGTQAVIDAVNASGGIRGTKIKLITLDDNFVPARSPRQREKAGR